MRLTVRLPHAIRSAYTPLAFVSECPRVSVYEGSGRWHPETMHPSWNQLMPQATGWGGSDDVCALSPPLAGPITPLQERPPPMRAVEEQGEAA